MISSAKPGGGVERAEGVPVGGLLADLLGELARAASSGSSPSTSSLPAGISSRSGTPIASRGWRTSQSCSSSSRTTIADRARVGDQLAVDDLAVLVAERVAPDGDELAVEERLGADALELGAHATAASSRRENATSSIESSAATETRSVGSWLCSVPLATLTRRDAGRLEDVRVRRAAGGDALGLVAVGAQRGLGGDDRRRGRLEPVADDLLLGDHVDVALAVAGAVVQRVDHRGEDLLGLVGVDRADLGEQPRALGDDVGGLDPAVQVADVRRRLRRRCGRAASRSRRARRRESPSGPPPGAGRRGRTCRGTRPRPGTASARR